MAQHWVTTRYGDLDGLELQEVTPPAPGPGEVTIEVLAAGMNPADYKRVLDGRDASALPAPIGFEVAGVLSAVGEGTEIASGPAQVGDEVLAFRVRGGYATALTVPAKDVFAKPANLAPAEAANLLLVGCTAAEMLDVVHAQGGETVLLHGASGAVGVSVLQQARRHGVRVVGTASEANFDVVERFGGIPVAYGPGLADRVRAAAPGGIAAALDAVGTDEAVDVSLAVVPDRSRIVTIAAARRAQADGITMIGGAMPASAAFRDRVRGDLIALAAGGDLVVPLARTFPLAEAREALALLRSGHPGGKLALLPGGRAESTTTVQPEERPVPGVPGIHVGPDPDARLEQAVRDGGGQVVGRDEAVGVVFHSAADDPAQSTALVTDRTRWVQLPHAGVERWTANGLVTTDPVWTSAAGAYGPQVAEHAFALMLAGAKELPVAARATTWERHPGRMFAGSTVALVGYGGIGRCLLPMLAPFGCRVLAVTDSGPVEGADVTVARADYRETLPEADFVVLLAALTPQTRGMIGAAELDAMRDDAWLVNVGRGGLVDTDALVAALREERIGGAALDVTDPEPLPDGHPLWSLPNALITPHVANPPEAHDAALAERVTENVRRFVAGEPLVGVIDPEAGF